MISSETGIARVVLVVDDDSRIRQFVRVLLEREKFSVIEASDGLEAWEALRGSADCVTLVITDIRMPRMTGIEFATLAKRAFPGLPMIFISGEAPPLDMKAHAFVEKPFTPIALLEAVHERLEATALAGK